MTIIHPGSMAKTQVSALKVEREKRFEIQNKLELRIKQLEQGISGVVNAYRKQCPLRTADFHDQRCDCLRCKIDDAEALLKRK